MFGSVTRPSPPVKSPPQPVTPWTIQEFPNRTSKLSWLPGAIQESPNRLSKYTELAFPSESNPGVSPRGRRHHTPTNPTSFFRPLLSHTLLPTSRFYSQSQILSTSPLNLNATWKGLNSDIKVWAFFPQPNTSMPNLINHTPITPILHINTHTSLSSKHNPTPHFTFLMLFNCMMNLKTHTRRKIMIKIIVGTILGSHMHYHIEPVNIRECENTVQKLNWTTHSIPYADWLNHPGIQQLYILKITIILPPYLY